MASQSLDHIEQTIAETEMRITLQRALMERTPEGTRQTPEGTRQAIAMAVLQDGLRQKMAIRQDVQDGIGIPAPQ